MKRRAYTSYRKLIVIVISLIVIFQLSPKVFANDKNRLEEGSLTYYIETAEEFNNIRTTPGAIYILMNDIDLGQNQVWEPISNFSGTLYGQGYTIKGLQINNVSGNVGLFGENTGTIKHLIVEKPQISGKEGQVGSANIGVIAGKNRGLIEDVSVINTNLDLEKGIFSGKIVGGIAGENTGIIERCHVDGKIEGRVVGGLVGKNLGKKGASLGIIRCSSFIGDIEGSGESDRIGGLVGNNLGEIKNCFSKASLKIPSGSKAFCVGGIAGENDGDVSYCYASVKIIGGSTRIIGVASVGNNYLKDTLFYDKEIMGLSPSIESGEGKSTTQMKLKATYVGAGWNFESIWAIEDGETYPYFREPGDLEDLDTPGESDNLGDLDNPGESGNLEDLDNPEKTDNPGGSGDQDEQKNLEDLQKPDEAETKDEVETEDKAKTIQEPTHPKKSESQRQYSAVRLEEPQLIEGEKQLTPYFINPKNIDFKYLREVLVRHHLSKPASQVLKPSKPSLEYNLSRQKTNK